MNPDEIKISDDWGKKLAIFVQDANDNWIPAKALADGTLVIQVASGTNDMGVVHIKKTTSTLLNRPSGTITANGDSGNLSASSTSNVLVGINVTAITDNVTFYVDSLGADGVWYNIHATAQITAIGQTVVTLSPPNDSLGETIRLRWAVGGLAPSITFSASIIGSS